jgi:hypothetical protein
MTRPDRSAFVSRAPRPSSDDAGVRRIGPPSIDSVVQHLNRLHMAKSLETAKAIGEFMLEVFYDGDINAVRNQEHAGHVSLRKLARHPGLEVSYGFIAQAVGLVEHLKLLPKHLADQLNFSQHRALVPLRIAAVKVVLAQRAIDQRLTATQLREEVQKIAPDDGSKPKGRPPKSPASKISSALRAVLSLLPIDGDPASGRGPSVRDAELDALIEKSQQLTLRLQLLRTK